MALQKCFSFSYNSSYFWTRKSTFKYFNWIILPVYKSQIIQHLFVASILRNWISSKNPAWFPFSVLSQTLFHIASTRCIVGPEINASAELLPHSLLCCNVNALKQQPENFLCATRVTELWITACVLVWPLRLSRQDWGSCEQRKVSVCQDIEMRLVGVNDRWEEGADFNAPPTPPPHPKCNNFSQVFLHTEDSEWEGIWQKHVWFSLAQKRYNRHASAEFSNLWDGCVSEKHPALKNSTPRMTQKTVKARNTGELEQELCKIVIQANFCGLRFDTEYFSRCFLNLQITCAGHSHCPVETNVIWSTWTRFSSFQS